MPRETKRKRALNLDRLRQVFENEPDDYEAGWKKLGENLEKFGKDQIDCLAPSSLSLPDAHIIFDLTEVDDVVWSNIDMKAVPTYLHENIRRIFAITTPRYRTNEAFSRTVIDQILISAIYEENKEKGITQAGRPHSDDDLAVLELQYETAIERQVTFRGKPRLLKGNADYTVWYDNQTATLATNLIIVEARRGGSPDVCLGQLTAYMGAVHACRKDEGKRNALVYGVASDGNAFRFVCIDEHNQWSSSRLMEWKRGDGDKIYSVFRKLIQTAANSSPSTLPIKDAQKRETIIASFGSPERSRNFDYALRSALELVEVDSDTEIIDI